MKKKLPTEAGAIVGNFAIYMAYALMSSGHLPFMMPIAPSSCLGRGGLENPQFPRGSKVQGFEGQLSGQVSAPPPSVVGKLAQLQTQKRKIINFGEGQNIRNFSSPGRKKKTKVSCGYPEKQEK